MSGERVDPRVARTRHAVLHAAREVLVEDGWEDVTIAKVAERSGLARATLYRHWPNRLDLLNDLIRDESHLTHTTPTGDLRDDLVAELTAFVHAVADSGLGHAIIAIAHRARTDEAFEELIGSIRSEGTAVLIVILDHARERGELRQEVRAELASAQLVGPVLYSYLFDHSSQTQDLIEHVVEQFIVANAPHGQGERGVTSNS